MPRRESEGQADTAASGDAGGRDAEPDLGVLVERYRQEQLAAGPGGTDGPSPVLEEIAARSVGRLRRIARRLTRTADGRRKYDPEDLLQQAWADRLQKALAPGRPPVNDTEHFFRLAFTAFQQTLLDLVKSDRREKRGGGRGTVKLAAEPAVDPSSLEDTQLDIRTAVMDLDAQDRQTLKMRVTDGVSRETMAATLHVTVAEARKRLSGARGRLAARLRSYGG